MKTIAVFTSSQYTLYYVEKEYFYFHRYSELLPFLKDQDDLLPSISNLSPTSETDEHLDPVDEDLGSQEDSQSQVVDDQS
jgi:hypothetical protein